MLYTVYAPSELSLDAPATARLCLFLLHSTCARLSIHLPSLQCPCFFDPRPPRRFPYHHRRQPFSSSFAVMSSPSHWRSYLEFCEDLDGRDWEEQVPGRDRGTWMHLSSSPSLPAIQPQCAPFAPRELG